MASVPRYAAVIGLALVLVASAAVTGVGGASDHSSGEAADEIYVEDDGDVVLVYDEEGDDDSPQRVEMGAHVPAGVVYGLIEDPVDEAPDVRGRFTTTADRTSVSADGSLSAPQPDWLTSFELSGSGEATAENSRSDLELSTVVVDETGYSAFIQSASTSGEMVSSASRFQLTADAQVSTVVPSGPETDVTATLRETGDEYRIEADVTQPVSEWSAAQWHNRSATEQTIREQFDLEELAEETTVAIDSHSFTEIGDGQYLLETRYTVTYHGVDDTLEEMVRAALAEEPDVSEEQAERLARGAADVEINEVTVSYAAAGGDYDVGLTVDVENYDGLLLAYYELASSMDVEGTFGTNLDQARKQFEAQRASGVEQRYTWSAEMSHPDSDSVEVQANVRHRTENWAAFVDELDARDVPRYDSNYELDGGIDGERVTIDGSFGVSGETLYRDLLAQMDNSTTEDPEAAEMIEALRDAEFQKAKLDTSYDDDGFRLEMAAAFENMAVLRDVLVEQSDVPAVREAVARSENGTGDSYLYVDGAVGGDASESDVRALSYVGADTTVHMPGDWDREFPSMDVERAESFLELGSAGGIGPGFGPLGAMVALIVGSLIALRRR